jgi:hypothetical protein
MTVTREHKTTYGKKTLVEDTLLLDYDSEWNDWFGYKSHVAKKGTRVGIRVEEMADGRVYYTAFLRVAGRLYSATKFRQTPDAPVKENVAASSAHSRVVEELKLYARKR